MHYSVYYGYYYVQFYGKIRSDIISVAGAGIHGSDGEKYKQKHLLAYLQ